MGVVSISAYHWRSNIRTNPREGRVWKETIVVMDDD
jgi:hypothetical protein